MQTVPAGSAMTLLRELLGELCLGINFVTHDIGAATTWQTASRSCMPAESPKKARPVR